MMVYGYFTPQGFVGRIDGRMMLFASEDEYLEYVEEKEKSNCLIQGGVK